LTIGFFCRALGFVLEDDFSLSAGRSRDGQSAGHLGILLDEEDRRAVAVNLGDDLEDRLDQ
jgi:hypothetical protein